MEFDPSQFLSLGLAEEQNTYSAPNFEEPPQGFMTVEGGLQGEEGMHIPVPLFGNLQLDSYGENGLEEEGVVESCMVEPTIEISESMDTDTDNCAPMQPSPSNGTASPQLTGRKIITSYDESRFRRDFYCGKFERVKLYRLHCTICDKHLGCAPWLTERQMRTHKLLSVSVCRKCHEFYGDINFPIDDGSEIYCCWCGEGGDVFCCAKCPKTVCKKCVARNFGDHKLKEIEDNDNWVCFVCDPTDIYPHRAMFYGLQRFAKEMRQKFASLTKEERQNQLSKDTSHCCNNKGILEQSLSAIELPYKSILTRVPMCLIAEPYQVGVKNQPDRRNPNSYIDLTKVNPRPTSISNNLRAQSLVNRAHLAMATKNRIVSPHPIGPPYPVMQVERPRPGNVGMKIHRPQQKSGPPYSAMQIDNPRPGNAGMKIHRPQQKLGPPYPAMQVERSRPGNAGTKIHRPQQISPYTGVQKDDSFGRVVNSCNNWSGGSLQQNTTEINIDWLQKGVDEVSSTLRSLQRMLNQYDSARNEFKHDVTKLSSFSDIFSHNIKIAICSLAKTNQDVIENRKIAVDDHVSSVVNNIRASVTSSPVNLQLNQPATPEPPVVADTPQEEDVPDVNALLLCETVMEVEGNKENENANKHPRSPVKRSPAKSNSVQKRMSSFALKRRKLLQKNSSQAPIQVIDLIDDDDFDESYHCKKYNVKPCRVLLRRLPVK